MIGIGLYGNNGHQIQRALADHPRARLVATVSFDPSNLPDALRSNRDMRRYPTLDDLLADDRVELVSLCSPRRRDQAAETVRCLEAGKHCYAEKPCAMTEDELDLLIGVAGRATCHFREMGGTAFVQPFLEMREIVLSGRIGEVVQIFAQKSYPYFDARPQDEDVDGGLTCQAGVHALRMIEHCGGAKVAEIDAIETKLGNPKPGELRMATSYIMRLENGGVATALANYLNPHEGFGMWGNDQLRIFGTKGFVEAVDGGTRTRLVIGDKDYGPIDTSAPSLDYFEAFLDEIEGKGAMPLSLEDELHPTRMVIRARESAQRQGGR